MSTPPFVSFRPQHAGISVIDEKTPVSFAVGLLAGASGLNTSWATVTVVGFEALLVMLEESSTTSAFQPRSPQSYANQMFDVIAGIVGVHYGEQLQKKVFNVPNVVQKQQPQPQPQPQQPQNQVAGVYRVR